LRSLSVIWILIYDILCVGVLGFIVFFGAGIGLGYKYEAAGTFVKIVINSFNYLVATGCIFGFVLLIIGSTALIYNKDWGKRVSVIGIWFAFALACGTIGLAFIFAMPPPRWSFDNEDFIFFIVIGAIISFFAIVILRKLKKL
jgi:hypothetical protein